MFLEKIKIHGGKVIFFLVNILIVVVGVVFIKQKDDKQLDSPLAEADVQNYKESAGGVSGIQENPETKIEEKKEENLSEAVAPSKVENVDSSKSVQSSDPAPVAAVVQSPKINGTCGSADSSAKRKNSKCDGKAPSVNLCGTGSASAVTFKPNKYDIGWDWKCEGKNGGASVTCRCS